MVLFAMVVVDLDFALTPLIHVGQHDNVLTNQVSQHVYWRFRRRRMKVSREQVARNRLNILEAASRLFSERGFDAVTIVDVMKDAGLTHGGFYGYFGSKDELIAEASAFSLKRQEEVKADTFEDYCAGYLSAYHRQHRAGGCTFAALASEAVRQAPAVRHEMTESLRRMIEVIAELAPGEDAEGRRRTAISGFSAMLGGLILSRMVDDISFSDELLEANREVLDAIAMDGNDQLGVAKSKKKGVRSSSR